MTGVEEAAKLAPLNQNYQRRSSVTSVSLFLKCATSSIFHCQQYVLRIESVSVFLASFFCMSLDYSLLDYSTYTNSITLFL